MVGPVEVISTEGLKFRQRLELVINCEVVAVCRAGPINAASCLDLIKHIHAPPSSDVGARVSLKEIMWEMKLMVTPRF